VKPAAGVKLSGTLWLLAGLAYLAAEAIAATAYPGYSYVHNYISDLGIPYPVAGNHSSLAWVMNFGGFILDGILYGAAALIAYRSGASRAFLLVALTHAVGTILVGAVHSGPREVASGTHAIHVTGAAMAIIGGNLTSIVAGHFGAPAYRRISLGLGLFGLVSLTLLEANRVLGTTLLPDGLFERGSVYAITAWEILTGAMLRKSARPR
jgi:hypothetical membrane protein